MTIQASIAGIGVGSVNGRISFDPLVGNQRPGLLLLNGLVYIGWASHCDLGFYHGWVIAYNAGTLQQAAIWNATVNGSDGGVWMSGAAPSADSSGNVFLATGNGTFNLNLGEADAGDSILRFGPPTGGFLPVIDFFTPYNQSTLNLNDQDLGSGGLLLLPDLPAGSAHPHLLTTAGKQGTLYVVDRDGMGHYTPGSDQVVQTIPTGAAGLFATPAFWNNTVYIGGVNQKVQAFSFNANNSGLLSNSAVSSTPQTYYFPGPTPSISANGNSNGILWALQNDSYYNNGPAVLHAYDAANLAVELYNSNMKAGDTPGPAVKFTLPTVSNGKVYVGTATQLAVYGIASVPPVAPVLLSPANGSTGVGPTAALNWSASAGAASYDVYLGTSSPPPMVSNTAATSYTTAALNGGTTYYWQIIARNASGTAASSTWSFTTDPCPLSLSPSAIFLDASDQPPLSINVSVPSGCAWNASTNGSFINITSGTSGSGNGVVSFSVSANDTGEDLDGDITVANQTALITQRETDTIFTDVADPSTFYFNAANLMYTKGITNGCLAAPLMYCPGDLLTRGQIAVFLVRSALGGDNFTYSPMPYFTDVPDTYPFFKWIQKLKELQITNGCTGATFCPDDLVTRGQAAAFVIRARYGPTATFSYPPTAYFTDVPPSAAFFSYIQKMAQVGITNGCAASAYCPDSFLTRGEVAVFDMRGLFDQLLPPNTAILIAASPNSAGIGQTVTVALTGTNTHFVQGVSQVTTAPGVTASTITVTSDTSLTVQLLLNSAGTPGPYSLVVTTGAEEAVLPNGFTVQ